tara:strand:+ start:181 stop:648 length:468 start_codon:yes stop_codon:yes gene_type:complete
MVKYHVLTDREYRYKNRCNGKTFKELKSEIIKNAKDYSALSDFYRRSVNMCNSFSSHFDKLKHSYDFLYNQYSHLFETNRNNTERVSELEHKFLKKKDDYIKLSEKYNDLYEKYTQLIDEFVEDNIEKSKTEDNKDTLEPNYADNRNGDCNSYIS